MFVFVFIEVVTGNAYNHTVLSTMPFIKSPIVFLVVNFVLFYAILVIIICLCGLYENPPETNRLFVRGKRLEKTHEFVATDVDEFSDFTSRTQSSDESFSHVNSLVLPNALQKSDFVDHDSSWTGDWNTYWNSKLDY